VAWSTFRRVLPSLTYEEARGQFDSHLAVRGFCAQRQELREREEARLRACLAEGETLHSEQDVELAAGDSRTIQFFAYYSGHEPGQKVLLTSLPGPESMGAYGQNPLSDEIRLCLGEASLDIVPARRGAAGDPRSCVRLRVSNQSTDHAAEPMVIPAGTAYARLRLEDIGVAATNAEPRDEVPSPMLDEPPNAVRPEVELPVAGQLELSSPDEVPEMPLGGGRPPQPPASSGPRTLKVICGMNCTIKSGCHVSVTCQIGDHARTGWAALR
jgi:hypothetical protein